MIFKDLIKEELLKSTDYYTDNFDYIRFKKPSVRKKIFNWLKLPLYQPLILQILFKSDVIFNNVFLGKLSALDEYMGGLSTLYGKLNDEESKNLLLKLLAYRILGYVKVKLPYHVSNYWNTINTLDQNKNTNSFTSLDTYPWKLNEFDLNPHSFNIKIHYTALGCYRTFVREHYKYHTSQITIAAQEDDIVLDLGGCYGDTALYFAHQVGKNGKVFTFEFIPGNLKVLKSNFDLNPKLSSQIDIVENPVWETSDKTIFYHDAGPGSKVSFEKSPDLEGTTTTLSIDDFVRNQGLEKVDFIKTDIEGAEPYALKGAEHTIRKFKPRLAISIYHNMDDFTKLINMIDELDLGYEFYLGHASIHKEETVLFCISNR